MQAGQPSAIVAHDLAQAASDVQRNIGALAQCYQRQLREQPTLADQVVIHWTIGGDSTVLEQCITQDTLGDFAVQTCVNTLIAHTRFQDQRSAALDVTLPIIFTAPS